ncbi:GntR family transcriptional regulator [Paenibacillus lycopersici]|uniref:GntR family transcriptional regulator n=1 Tax=Paenibacillus lycopersici TaxID=2704462 RepID=A0A6C0G1H0_9BACL|nr:GntR family transcriptional regulator [Paenibacillus lycopersici]QHT63308.1 GntR family transcriptional regulator [Paenibacillus lycopersici]
MVETAVTLKEKAYIHLRKLILEGTLQPGEVLTERMLVERLNMSRTPIRAALERLDVEGLAKYTPNKGLVVTELSVNKAIDLYDYRMAMECFVVSKLAQRAWGEGDRSWFEGNLKRQLACAEADDHAGFTEADAEFHRKLAEIYGNSEILHAMEQLQDKLYQVALTVLRKERARIKVSYEDHWRIYEAIQAHRGAEAAMLMERHLEFGKRILVF